MSLYSDTLSCFWVKPSLFLLFNAACWAEKQQFSLFCLWFDTTVDQNLELSIRDKHANFYTNESEYETKTKKEYTMYVTGKGNKYE